MSDEKIREEAKKALKERGLKCVIGWDAEGKPLFAETEEDIDKLSFNKLCTNNLVAYLTQEIRSQRGKTRDGKDKVVKPVGIVVRGCDSKALLLLLNENILSRKEVFIIGVPCTGVVDRLAGGALYRKCVKCAMRNPVVFDVLASEKVPEDEKDFSEVEAIERMTPEERWKFWEEIFADCIRCHACKRSCPVCYCEECLLDPTEVAIRPDTPADEVAAWLAPHRSSGADAREGGEEARGGGDRAKTLGRVVALPVEEPLPGAADGLRPEFARETGSIF